tara:strand:+ start:410 stop:748 length:339 start_codon:yes stop_codon:yes gene_type:complete
MPTSLTREVVRETTIEVDKRNLIVYLTPKQKLGFKLKGLKNEPFFFNLIYVYNKLMNADETTPNLDTDAKENLTETDKLCATSIIKDIQRETDIPYPYKRELVKYFKKKYGI